MAKHPAELNKLYDELADLDVGDPEVLKTLPQLNGVINEALRLYPSLPTGGFRKTTKNGMTIRGNFIPPNTTILAPRYSINRRKLGFLLRQFVPQAPVWKASNDFETPGEDCYVRPLDFVPERWSTRPDMIINKSGFTPFGTGTWLLVF